MIRFLGFLGWTACAMALGVWMATANVAGSTPLSRVEKLWHQSAGPGLEAKLQEKLQDTKDALETAHDKKPRERHSEQDKEAVSRLIAKRGAGK